MAWEFMPEKLQDLDKVTEYLQGKWCGNSRHEQLTAVCWTLATLHRTLVVSSQHPQGRRREQSNKPC